MQIERLVVRETVPSNRIIRNIEFKKNQLNLIVDATPNANQASGNSIGKSTAVKIIDLCLGAKSVKSIYSDTDTHTENIKIKNFLTEKKLTADLTLVTDEGKNYIITRELFPRGKRYIYGDFYKEQDFKNKLKELLFNSNETHPSVRTLLNRFIRLDNKQLENVITYLDGPHTKESYEFIHMSFLNAIDASVISKQIKYTEKLRELEKDLKKYIKKNNIQSIDALQQRLLLINSELEEKKHQRQNIDYIEDYKEELEKRSDIASRLDELFIEIESITFDIKMMQQSLDDLKNDKSDIPVYDLKMLYEEVSSQVTEISKSFSQLIDFHNKMIDNRVTFIEEHLIEKTNQLTAFKLEQETLLIEKQELSKHLVDENLLSDLNAINITIDDLNVTKGEVSHAIETYENYSEDIDWYKDKLSKLTPYNNEFISNRLKVFNEYFSIYSQILYAEKFFLSYNKEWKTNNVWPFTIGNVSGNMGTGKKRGLIIAFDLAYLAFINDQKMVAPQFIIHDKLENTHINQLDTIFNICSNIKGQYIVPILKERIDKIDAKIIEQATILTLSENDKFFKI